MKYIRLLVFVIAGFCLVQTRYISTSVNIGVLKRQLGWTFLDRMTFDEGIVQVKLTTKIKISKQKKSKNYDTVLHIIPQSAWPQQQTFKCNRNPQTKIIVDPNQYQNLDSRIIEVPITLTQEKQYEETIYLKFKINQTTTYHFVFKDCNRTIVSDVWKRENKLEFEMELKNGDLDHSSDEKINSYLLPLLVLATALMIYFSKRPSASDFIAGEKDWVKIILYVTLIFNLIAITFYWFGHILYVSVTGKFYGAFDFLYLMFHSISESVLTTMLIFIAFGWTITFIEDAEFDLYIPLLSMLGIINLILTLLGKINDGSSDKYHMYDTIPSYLLVFFRVVTVGIFIYGIVRSLMLNKKDKKLTDFFFRFGLMGSFYFLSLPAIMILAEMASTSNRKIYVFITVQLIKNGVNFLITWMVSSKKSKYANAKLSSRSFMEQNSKLL